MRSASYGLLADDHKSSCRCECSMSAGLVLLLYRLGLKKAMSMGVYIPTWQLNDRGRVRPRYRQKWLK